ncbi:MAG: hypothetical protein R3217_03045 [Gammaproteobacteria bacterium]|nr:hypothetical protein [Gammaproteobacteria bacterium]
MMNKGMKLPVRALVLAMGLVFASGAMAADDRVASALNDIGMAYNIDQDGDYAIVISFDDDRTQLVFVRSAVYDSRGVVMRDIWSPGYVHGSDDMPADLLSRLLSENVGTVMGNWARENREISYVVKLTADASATELRAAILEAAEQADELEKELLGSDDL